MIGMQSVQEWMTRDAKMTKTDDGDLSARGCGEKWNGNCRPVPAASIALVVLISRLPRWRRFPLRRVWSRPPIHLDQP